MQYTYSLLSYYSSHIVSLILLKHIILRTLGVQKLKPCLPLHVVMQIKFTIWLVDRGIFLALWIFITWYGKNNNNIGISKGKAEGGYSTNSNIIFKGNTTLKNIVL